MTASYPTSAKSFTAKANNTDYYNASHINDLQDEIAALEAQLIAAKLNGLAAPAANKVLTTDGSGVPGWTDPVVGLPTPAANKILTTDGSSVVAWADSPLGSWQTWVPGTSMGLTSISNSTFRYCLIGKTVFFYMNIDETAAVDATNIRIGYPVAKKSGLWPIRGLVDQAYDNYSAVDAIWELQGAIYFYRKTGSWTNNTNKHLTVHGWYEAA